MAQLCLLRGLIQGEDIFKAIREKLGKHFRDIELCFPAQTQVRTGERAGVGPEELAKGLLHRVTVELCSPHYGPAPLGCSSMAQLRWSQVLRRAQTVNLRPVEMGSLL